MSATTFSWMVTAPNPRHPGTGVDAGQRGWRLHAIPRKRSEGYDAWKRRPALCGLWPRHGWGGDLFIEDECARCQNAMTRREAAGEQFVDLHTIYEAERAEIEARIIDAIRSNKDMTDDEIDAMRARLRVDFERAAVAAEQAALSCSS